MKTARRLLALLIAVACTGCNYELINDIEEDRHIYDYYVDSYGNEGIVLLNTVGICIVMSLDEAEMAWSNENEQVYDMNSGEDKFSFGLEMLNIMCQKGISKYPAQNWCNDKNHGALPTIGSWRLPSYYECKFIFKDMTETQLATINRRIKTYGGVPLYGDDSYWTCTEDLEDSFSFEEDSLNVFDPAGRAINVTPYLKAYTNKDNWAKQKVFRVRAIKYVYYETTLY